MFSLCGVSQPLNENYQTLVYRYLMRMIKLGVSQPKMRMIKRRDRDISLFIMYGRKMISLYEIDDDYIDYLREYDSMVLSSKTDNRKYTRKYVGILLHNRAFQYFVPLSSYKAIYDSMYESISFKKIGDMAVLRINNMIPVDNSVIHRICFNEETDEKYRILLQNEYRILKRREREIRKDARIVYHYRLNKNNKDKKLYKICCDFQLLEDKLIQYHPKEQEN